MAEHTPAPWVIDNRPLYDGAGLDAKKVEKGAAICCVERAFDLVAIHAPATIGQPCPLRDEWDAIGNANAQVIIAAPDLLAACKAARSYVADAACDDPAHPVLAAIEAAIAKAEARP